MTFLLAYRIDNFEEFLLRLILLPWVVLQVFPWIKVEFRISIFTNRFMETLQV